MNSKKMLKIRQMLFLSYMIIPLVCLWAFYLAEQTERYNLYAWWTVFIFAIIMPVVEHILGKHTANHDRDQVKIIEQKKYYRIFVLLCIPIVFAQTIYGAWVFSTVKTLNWGGRIGWLLSIALSSAPLAMPAAHELIHKESHWERLIGSFLLAFVCNSGFKTEHLKAHHRFVATPADTSSAQMGQSFYHFLMRAYQGTLMNCWSLEKQRLNRKGCSALNWRNELIWLHLLTLVFASVFYFAFGMLGLIFFIGQGCITMTAQHLANYIQHYGLSRRNLYNNRYERFSPAHAWRCDFLLSNMLSFHLPRHADHHIHPRRRYQVLRHLEEGPQMPTGYIGMFCMALIPPLWYSVMHPRILAYVRDSRSRLSVDDICIEYDRDNITSDSRP